MKFLLVAGNLMSEAFHEALLLASDIADQQEPGQLRVEAKPMCGPEFEQYLALKRRELRGRPRDKDAPFIVHSQYGYLGSTNEMVRWATMELKYTDARLSPDYKELVATGLRDEVQKASEQYIRKSGNRFAYMDFLIGERGSSTAERVTFELYAKVCPKACENFVALCKGNMGRSALHPDAKYHYVNTPIHRVLKDCFIQGGDIMDGRGRFSESIWGNKFDDESYTIKFDHPGMLAMVGDGSHANGSQFLITLKPLDVMQGKQVAFGRVVGGMKVIEKINALPQTASQKPFQQVCVVEAGELVVEPEPEVDIVAEARARLANYIHGPPDGEESTVVFLGLDGAGKSTIVNHYAGKPWEEVTPTNGFELTKAEHKGHTVRCFGLGGNKGIRGYWDNYFDEAHAMVFVIDASDRERLSEACNHLVMAMNHPQLQGKPVLVYLNKQDLDNPLSATELALGLKQLDRGKAPLELLTSNALITQPSQPRDPCIVQGLEWLLEQMGNAWPSLDKRVKADVTKRRAEERRKREAKRRARLRGSQTSR